MALNYYLPITTVKSSPSLFSFFVFINSINLLGYHEQDSVLASNNELKASCDTKMYKLVITIEIIATLVKYMNSGVRLVGMKVLLQQFLANALREIFNL